MTILRQFYQSCAPFCISNLLNFWFPDDNLWVNGQMCYLTFRHFLLKILQNNFSIWTYKVTLASGDPWPTTFYFYIVVELLALRVRLSFFCCIVKLYIFRLHILYRFFWSKYICTYICKTQIDVQFSNIWQFFTFSNRRPMTYTSNDVTPVRECFEAMMEKGQDQIPDEGFLMTKMPMYFIVTVDKILLCLGLLLL